MLLSDLPTFLVCCIKGRENFKPKECHIAFPLTLKGGSHVVAISCVLGVTKQCNMLSPAKINVEFSSGSVTQRFTVKILN